MKRNNVGNITVAASMLAIAVLLPQFLHILPIKNLGNYLLPMHIPVFLCGFFTTPSYGCIVGLISPLLSFLLTGMPNPVRLIYMMLELAAYGLSTGLLYRYTRKLSSLKRIYLTLAGSMIIGRLFYLICVLISVYVFNAKTVVLYTFNSSLTMGILGILLQLMIIPGIVMATGHAFKQSGKKSLGDSNTFVCKKDGKIFTSTKRGVSPMLELLEENPSFLDGSTVADKVIGRAAAFLLIKGNVKKLYTSVISEHALDILYEYGKIEVYYDTKVSYIVNRNNDGMCPMEEATLNISDPDTAYLRIIETQNKLRKA